LDEFDMPIEKTKEKPHHSIQTSLTDAGISKQRRKNDSKTVRAFLFITRAPQKKRFCLSILLYHYYLFRKCAVLGLD